MIVVFCISLLNSEVLTTTKHQLIRKPHLILEIRNKTSSSFTQRCQREASIN